MNIQNSKEDILDLIKRKEKKTLWINIGLIGLCVLLGITTIYYGREVQEREDDLRRSNSALEIISTRRYQDSISSEIAKGQYEDSIRLLNESLIRIKSFLREGVSKEEIEKKIGKEIADYKSNNPIIYIHYFGSTGEKLAKAVAGKLKENQYPAKGVEHIKTAFVSRISYFHKEDLVLANELSMWVKEVLKTANIKTDLNQFTPQLSTMKAPRKQVEIWIDFDPKVVNKDLIGKRVIEKERQFK